MLKSCSLIFFLCFCAYNVSFGQIEGSNITLTGYSQKLVFDCKGAHTEKSKNNDINLTSSISDTFGNLLFYVNDGTIYDNNDNKIAALDSFSESIGSDFELIAPNPANYYEYYIFNSWHSSSGLLYKNFYTLYNVSLKKVISRGVLCTNQSYLTSKKVPGRQKYWLTFTDSGNIASFLLDSNGLHTSPVISKKLEPVSGASLNNSCTQMAYYDSHFDSLDLTILNFNNSSGIFSQAVYVSMPKLLISNGCYRGYLAFSPDDKKLYITIGCGCGGCQGFRLVQCNISKDIPDSIKKSAVILTNPDKNRGDWTSFIYGPDCRLYNSNYAGIIQSINDPDSYGINCGYVSQILAYGSYNWNNFLTRQDYWPSFSVDTGSNNQKKLIFSYNAPKAGELYKWDFGDPTSGAANYDTGNVVSHIFIPNKLYYIRLNVYVNSVHTTFTRMVCTKGSIITNVHDTIICNDSLFLNAGNPGAKFLWSNGDTLQTNTISKPGKYWLRISNDSSTLIDTFIVKTGKISVNLGPDKSICNGDSLRFALNIPGATYLWSSGNTDSSLIAKKPGTYWVIVNSKGCIVSDTVNLKVLNPSVNIGPDKTICDGQNETLKSNISIGTFLWSTGDSTKTINVNKSRKYWLRVDSGGCFGYDTMTLTIRPSPAIVPHSIIYFCPLDSPNIHLTENGPYHYTWMNGDTTESIEVDRGGTYKIVLINNYGCATTDSFIVVSDCEDKIFIPNSFSPDGNHLNDSFKAKGLEIAEFHMDIYNRWGEHIFNTSDINKGWDGSFRGTTVPEGLYLYKISYKFHDQLKGSAKGTVMLFR